MVTLKAKDIKLDEVRELLGFELIDLLHESRKPR
jgi:hypothetical protein